MWEASEMAKEHSHPNDAFYWDRSRGNCVLAYNSSLDISDELGRPIAIQVEDYSDGDYDELWYQSALSGGAYNVKSSMPLVFMAVMEANVDESYLR